MSTVLEELLPSEVAAVEAVGESLEVELFPEEEQSLGPAVERRRSEFTTTRACARRAFAMLDLPPQPVPSGAKGEPVWPASVVGSITHCEGYGACAIARADAFITVGIDAEPNEPLPDGVAAEIASADELLWLAELAPVLPEVHLDRLLYSAKESVYKAWFPLARRWLDFDAAGVTIDPAAGTFAAQLLAGGPQLEDGPLTELSGRWLARDGLIITATALPAVRTTDEQRSGSG